MLHIGCGQLGAHPVNYLFITVAGVSRHLLPFERAEATRQAGATRAPATRCCNHTGLMRHQRHEWHWWPVRWSEGDDFQVDREGDVVVQLGSNAV